MLTRHGVGVDGGNPLRVIGLDTTINPYVSHFKCSGYVLTVSDTVSAPIERRAHHPALGIVGIRGDALVGVVDGFVLVDEDVGDWMSGQWYEAWAVDRRQVDDLTYLLCT